MLTPQIDDVGLGFFLGMGGNPNAFGHNGADEGFQAILIMISDSGQGAVIMADSDNGVELGQSLIDNIAKEYGWKYTPAKPRAAGALSLVQLSKGSQAAIHEYSYLKQSAASQFEFDESTLNLLGYQILSNGKAEDAIKVFQLNVQEYPNSWNCYDSLAEAYMKAGREGPCHPELQ